MNRDRPLAAIIMALGRGERRLDGNESLPRGMSSAFGTPPSLQWILTALEAHGASETIYIGGYHLEKIVDRFPDIKVRYFRDWQERGEAAALGELLSSFPDRDILVLRADTLVLPSALARLLSNREESGRLVLKGELSGERDAKETAITFLPADRAEEFRGLALVQGRRDFATDLNAVVRGMSGTQAVDLTGEAALLADRQAVRRLVFRGKAQTLEQLANLVTTARLPDRFRFSAAAWIADPKSILRQIRNRFESGRVVIRSSTVAEDSPSSSGAGRFVSELDIDVTDGNSTSLAVAKVIESYRRDGRSIDRNDEVLVQPQIEGLISSGVVLTRDPTTGAPYYVVNYEAGSGRSDVVTSGGAGQLRTNYCSWDCAPSRLPGEIAPVIALADELRNLTYDDALDIEFGRDGEGRIHLFQVRPMAMPAVQVGLFDDDLAGFRRAAIEHFGAHAGPHPELLGAGTIFANMSDWNPAEMIGTEPRPLALSIYQRLIGDWTWAAARARIGYRNVGPQPLIHALGGRPYVDVRASLNSLLPADLDESIGGRWVDGCLLRLREDPTLQDKLEFEITATCLAPDWPRHVARMRAIGLSEDGIDAFRAALGRLTRGILVGPRHGIDGLLEEVRSLDGFRAKSLAIEAASPAHAIRKVQMLLDRCARHGAMPFAILARYAFVAIALLRALRECGILDPDEFDGILRAIPTVAGEFAKDLVEHGRDAAGRDFLISKYGHLRPNSYDITALSYAEQPEMLLSAIPEDAGGGATWADAASTFRRHAKSIQSKLDEFDLGITWEELAAFVKAAVAARERAKFEFMKTIDEVMTTLVEFGTSMGLSRDDLSFVPIEEILRFSRDSASGATAGRLRRIVTYRRKRHSLTQALRLPEVVTKAEEIEAFERRAGRPNFVTRKRVVAPVAFVERFSKDLDLRDRIVAIRAADPGFDWIFGRGIAGLITEYGGIASHMAIRAAEFGLPAAIGCGSVIFERAIRARRLDLDCANERIDPHRPGGPPVDTERSVAKDPAPRAPTESGIFR